MMDRMLKFLFLFSIWYGASIPVAAANSEAAGNHILSKVAFAGFAVAILFIFYYFYLVYRKSRRDNMNPTSSKSEDE